MKTPIAAPPTTAAPAVDPEQSASAARALSQILSQAAAGTLGPRPVALTWFEKEFSYPSVVLAFQDPDAVLGFLAAHERKVPRAVEDALRAGPGPGEVLGVCVTESDVALERHHPAPAGRA